MPRGLLLVVCVLCAIPLAVALAAQVSPPVVEDVVRVDLVNVSVLVTDSDGTPVLDLDQKDFRVFEDGRLVDPTHFSRPAVGRASASDPPTETRGPDRRDEQAASIAPASPGRYVVFWDELNTSAAYRAPLLAQIVTVLEERLNPQDFVMVASFDGSIQVRQPFTRSRKELLEALRGLAFPRAVNFSFLAASERAIETIKFAQDSRFSGSRNGTTNTPRGGPGLSGDDPCVDVGYLARSHADATHNQLMGTIGALTRFVDSLAGVPGRKALLHVSDGMPLIAGGEVWEYAIELCDPRGVTEGLDSAWAVPENARYSRFDPATGRMDMTTYDTSSEWQRLAAHANSQQVTFYPVQLTGLRSAATAPVDGVRRTLETAILGHHNLQDPLVMLAVETGGRAILNTNDFRPGLSRMVEEGQAVYELAFPPATPGDRELHEIRVEVDRPGVQVRYRKSYQSKSAEERTIDGLFSTLLHGYEENPLDVRMKVEGQTPVDDRTARVVVQIRLPIENLTLLERGDSVRGTFVAYLAARDAHGRTTDVRHQFVPVTLSGPDRDKQLRKDFTYEVDLELRRLPHDIALAVRDGVGGAVSYARTSVRVD